MLSRKMFLRHVGCCIAALVLGSSWWADVKAQERPNVLFIMSDDHANKAISTYGDSDIETPHLDRLAREGMQFNNCFVTNSICTPSRACIMTGLYGHKSGVTSWQPLNNRPQITFPGLLRKNGYHTMVVGKWHLRSEPKDFHEYIVLPGQGAYYDPIFKTSESGWDLDDEEDAGGRRFEGYVTNIITDLALEYLENRPKDKPFCMLLHHKAPHDYWEYDIDLKFMFENETIPEPETMLKEYPHREFLKHVTCKMGMEDCSFEDSDFHEQIGEVLPILRQLKVQKERFQFAYQYYIKSYLRCVRSIDNSIGRILDYLEENDLADNTLVIYTSDQGYFLGEHALFDKRLMYEPSLRTPLLVRLPGMVQPGSINYDLVLNLDFAQTILDVAGVTVPEQMQGRSFKPLLQGKSVADWRDSMYYHFYDNGHFRIPSHLGVRTGRYKLICFYGDGKNEGNLQVRDDIFWELYDIQVDPQETKNLYHDPDYSSIVKDLKKELARLQRQYGDTEAPQVDQMQGS
jgi:arylsulfatase A-like enzyme